MLKKIIKSERGITLVEVLVALALLGLIASAFLMAISTATKAIYIADERTTAESLARSQLEYVKELPYEYDATEYAIDTGLTLGKYSLTVAVYWLHFPNDDGIQKITVTVQHHDYEVLTLEGYKVDAGVY